MRGIEVEEVPTSDDVEVLLPGPDWLFSIWSRFMGLSFCCCNGLRDMLRC